MGRKERILEQINAGELSPDKYIGENIFADLTAIKNSDKALLEKYPAEEVKKAVLEKLQAGKAEYAAPRRYLNIRVIGAVAAALCLAVLVPVTVSRNSASSAAGGNGIITEQSEARIKGKGAVLHVYKKTETEPLLLKNGSKVSAGDTIQLSYIASGKKYGAVISVDGNGVVTQHLPESGSDAVALSSEGEIPLDYSYKLDNAPDFERFIFMTSNEPFSFNGVLNAAESLNNKQFGKNADFSVLLPEQVSVSTFLLNK